MNDEITIGMLVEHVLTKQQMVVMWVAPEKDAARCRWLNGLEWKDELFRLDELEFIGSPSPI